MKSEVEASKDLKSKNEILQKDLDNVNETLEKQTNYYAKRENETLEIKNSKLMLNSKVNELNKI